MDAPFASAAGADAAGKLFLDYMSQPGRACAYFVHLCRLPVTISRCTLSKGEQKQESYLAMNPLGQVPCLCEADGFALGESSAILKYLADRHQVPDHWRGAAHRALTGFALPYKARRHRYDTPCPESLELLDTGIQNSTCISLPVTHTLSVCH
jgi:hypothetical protein